MGKERLKDPTCGEGGDAGLRLGIYAFHECHSVIFPEWPLWINIRTAHIICVVWMVLYSVMYLSLAKPTWLANLLERRRTPVELAEEGGKACCVCRVYKPTHIYLNCGHAGFCEKCCGSIQKCP